MCISAFAGCGDTDTTTLPAGSFSFVALGDAPYSLSEERRFETLQERVNAARPDFVLFLGDVLSGSCSDSVLLARFDLLQRFAAPVIYTPGDNEWTDCHRRSGGLHDPLDRLAKIRAVFFANPHASLGQHTIPVTSQAGDTLFAEFRENVRWTHGGITFVTLHVVGSWNGTAAFEARTAEHDNAVAARNEANMAWLRSAFRDAREADARGIFIGLHANLWFEYPPGDRRRGPFEDLLEAIEEEAEGFDGPVVLSHGDTHHFRVDRPLIRRTTEQVMDNVTRLEVFGSPDVGWVRVIVDTSSTDVFHFEPRKIGRWSF